MSPRFSIEGKTYRFLRRLFAVCNLLAGLIVLFANFDPYYHVLRRSGLIAAVLFSTANLLLVHWREEPSLGDERKGGAAQ
jgi:hypothetical protein